MESRERPGNAERLCVYVDGFNLYNGLRSRAGRSWLWLDLVELSRRLRPRSDVVKVKYFTTDVMNEPDAKQRQAHYLGALEARNRDRIAIYKGRYQKKSKRCPSCRVEFNFPEEKETDVSIAVHIVRDALMGHYDAALIVSADSDLAPAVKMVQQAKPDHFIACAFPPDRNSGELKHLMPASFDIYPSKITQSLLPDTFDDSLFPRTFNRPSKWH